jgi:hypothetical protein
MAVSALLWSSLCFGQNINFAKPADIAVPSAPFQFSLSATTDSGQITFDSTTKPVCTVSGTIVTLLAAGTCTVTATVGKVSVPQSFQVTVGTPGSFPGVDTVLGIGSLITGSVTNYTVNSTTNVLEGSQIGRASPQLLAGLAFQLGVPGITKGSRDPKSDTYHPWHAFVSLKFSTDSSQSIIGYTFGITYRVHKYLDLLLGYSLTPFQEPSPGFRNLAVQTVQANINNPKGDPYITFNGPALNNNLAGAFDGFPLQTPANSVVGTSGMNLYAGNPLETQYRGGMMIGISVALPLNGALGIPKKQ